MRNSLTEGDSTTLAGTLMMFIAVCSGFAICPKAQATNPSGSVVALFQAESGSETLDDQELSLRDLLGQQRPDDVSIDSQMDLDDDDGEELDTEENDAEEEIDDEDEALDIAKSKKAAIASALAKLHKPIQQVRVSHPNGISEGPADAASPVNRNDLDGVLIGDSGASIPLYQRRTICFSHRPLYFQQENLEVCGNGQGCWSNLFSATHFIRSVALLPCKISKQDLHCPVRATPDCRCGEERLEPVLLGLDCRPDDLRSTAVQTAVMAGFSFLLL